MGLLQDKVVQSQKDFGNNIVDFYKNNTLFMYEKLSKTDDDCLSVSVSDITIGRFYFLHYYDSSNWMKYSPIFCIDYRKVKDMIIILGVNFNFIPLEIRVSIFDKFISEQNYDKESPLEVDFIGMYTELIKYGFEYSIVEYNAIQISLSHRISLHLLPRFLYSSHPKNKYDPKKLMDIWGSKLKNREKRHQEMSLTILSDFYEIGKEIDNKYEVLIKHIERLQDSFNKFNKK